MPPARAVLRTRRALLGGAPEPADVILEGERIAGVELPSRRRTPGEDLGELVLMAGLVDAHVHVNEPGRTEWEGFAHATRAAAAGGTTTLADMPLNSVPATLDPAALAAKRAAAAAASWVDVGFHGGIVPANAHRPEILRALAWEGVLACKAFLCDSGVPELAACGRRDLAAAMPVLADAGLPLLVHAELLGDGTTPRAASTGRAASASTTPIHRYVDWEASRPGAWELRAVELLVELCRDTGCAVHVVHLSEAGALGAIRAAKAAGLPLTVETCPHYLHFCAAELPDDDARWKCAPPIRGAENRETLWSALADGTIDLVASDHSPCPPAMKRRGGGDLAAAWGGIASLQLMLPVLWTGARRRGIPIEWLGVWLARRPAELLGLDDRGSIAPGRLASLVAWDPDRSFVVAESSLLHRHPSTSPYLGEHLYGVVERTWVAGREVARAGGIAAGPAGRLIRRAARTPRPAREASP